MRRTLRRWYAVLALVGLVSCGGEPASGPGRVAWDRDACESCRMTISDRAFAAQVRGADGRLHRFDDPGCAVLWLRDHAEETPAREVWVRELDGDAWLDARTARFVEAPHTPMGYGYGAREAPPDVGIDFEALREAIALREDERRSPAH